MKKLMLFVMLATMLFSLANLQGCGQSKEQAAAEKAQKQAQELWNRPTPTKGY